MQTERLQAIMAVITKMTPTLQWKHSCKHHTQNKDTESGEYIAWLAYNHLEGQNLGEQQPLLRMRLRRGILHHTREHYVSQGHR